MNIITFLKARLDEAHTLAEAAHEIDPAPWSAGVDEEGPGPEYRNVRGNGLVIAADEVGLWDTEGSFLLCMTVPTTRHVAHWDPARVLRDVAAKREVIARTLNYMMRIDGEWGCCHSEESIAAGRCEELLPENEPIFRALAAVDSDHADFNPAWALPLER